MSSFSITVCQTQDVQRIREIQKEVWLATYPNKPNGVSKEAILVYFQDHEKTKNWINSVKYSLSNDKNTHGWVAKRMDEIVGYAFAQKMENKNKIMSLYVLPEYQRQGIGKKLMEEMLTWFTNKNPTILEVAVYNENAINFYKSFGFIENGVIHDDAAAVASGVVIPEIEMIKQ